MKVLISPGFGAGWSTWEYTGMAFDEVLIRAFECGISQEDMKALCIERGYCDDEGNGPYMGGFKQLKVVEVPSGTCFKIKEYDGHESLEYLDMDEWYYAEGEYYDCN